MALSKPVAVYNAENNVEAQFVCNFLEQHGVEAYVMLDESVVGMWTFGTLPEIHKPQVWTDQSSVDAVAPLLAEYERERLHRRTPAGALHESDSSIEVVCEDCGRSTPFPTSKRGTVQDCSHCGAYVDVEEDGGGAESTDWMADS